MKTEQQVTNTQSKSTLPKKGLTQRERRRYNDLFSLLLIIVTIVCVNAAITSLLINWRTPTVVSFDMRKTLEKFTEQVSAQSLDEAQTEVLAERFITSLNVVLHDWQRRNDALILVTPAVLSGAANITDEIQARVAYRMAMEGSH